MASCRRLTAVLLLIVCSAALLEVCQAARSPPPGRRSPPPRRRHPPPKRVSRSPPPKRRSPPPRPKRAQPFNFVVFGDSVSDNGNMKKLYPAVPNSTWYYNGRFSNGPNWVDFVNQTLAAAPRGSRVFNYAYASACFCKDLAFPPFVQAFPKALLGLSEQVDAFLADVQAKRVPMQQTAALIWLGNNDWLNRFALNDANTPAQVAVVAGKITTCLAAGMQRLLQAGVSTIYVGTLGALEQLPFVRASVPPAILTQIGALGDFHSLTLTNLVNAVNANLTSLPAPRPKLAIVDFQSMLRFRITNPLPGVNVTSTECLPVDSALNPEPIIKGPVCSNPQNYNFWDDTHPSTVVQEKAIFPLVETALKADGYL